MRSNIDLICPTCQSEINFHSDFMLCRSCGDQFVVESSVPILLSMNNKLFNKHTYSNTQSSGFNSSFKALISRCLPDVTNNRLQDAAIISFINTIKPSHKCLVIGSGHDQNLINKLNSRDIETTITDVFLAPNTDYVCDATSLPFKSSQFDCVIIIAVLEHVIDPIIAVSEISRVLKEDAKVFSAIPFMQQVHMGAFDYQRYTLLGHRWLFSSFEMVELAPTSRAGSALLWSIMSFFLSFTKNAISHLLIKTIIRLTFFWVKYFDILQSNSADYALGSYFIGMNKKHRVIDEIQLVKMYNQ